MEASEPIPRAPYLKLGLLALPPTLLLLDAGVALARGWRITSRIDIALVVAAAAVLAAFAIVLCSRRGRIVLRDYADGLAYVGFSLAGAWFAAEVVVAAVTAWYLPEVKLSSASEYHRRSPSYEYVFHPEGLPGIEGRSRYTTNSLGIRGPEFPPRDAAYRILFIGGSTTECSYLDDEEVWTHLVMRSLNRDTRRAKVWTGGIGISGYPTVNHLKFMQISPLMGEIDSIAMLIGANDFNQYLRGSLVGDDFGQGQQAAKKVFPLWHASPIIGLVRHLWGWRSSILLEDRRAQNVRARAVRRRQGQIRDVLPETLPPLETALLLYEKRVRAMIQAARRRGVRPVLITQPTLWREGLGESADNLLWLGDISVERGEYLSAAAGRAGIDRHNQVLFSVCREMQLECISTESMHGREENYYDDFHFNEAGSMELAGLVAEHFLRHATSEGWEPAR